MTSVLDTPWPPGAPRCRPGDVLVLAENGVVRLFRVDDVVRLVRLLPVGDDRLVDEDVALDSVRPAYAGQVHLLLVQLGGEFASPAEAAAVDLAGAVAEPIPRCVRLDGLAAVTLAHRPAGG
ncbi:hypothetical protein [Paractinoplanes durhamensis]|uniref:Uncharacterized protein n=1 Tax=Paractinoplanes durhamensis TaxID=113563 RepID=A0ABQ3Z781_9ACTN|nr:hypothetical protein [Actinoplanes durhamensis]GIE05659.1 hypothetical protein Adu01nite_70090 [Actinoplanes durhamensis]